MLQIDENELIEFFGQLPTKQSPEEQEFFGTSIFDIHRGRLRLSISFSCYHADMILYLYADGSVKPLLEMSLKEIHNLEVKRDKPEFPPFLFVTGKINADSCDTSGCSQAIRIIVDPYIQIKTKTE